ncbi:MAG: leucine-rich repeat domain-containing protein [Holosporales bacterium]|jgi:hypothetical protein|nr:leucine-rich repeat domain-containing protein [Holosporales bacterium]
MISKWQRLNSIFSNNVYPRFRDNIVGAAVNRLHLFRRLFPHDADIVRSIKSTYTESVDNENPPNTRRHLLISLVFQFFAISLYSSSPEPADSVDAFQFDREQVLGLIDQVIDKLDEPEGDYEQIIALINQIPDILNGTQVSIANILANFPELYTFMSTSTNVSEVSPSSTLVLQNQPDVAPALTNEQVNTLLNTIHTLVLVKNYAPTRLDFEKLIEIEALVLLDGQMTPELQQTIFNILPRIKYLEINRWGTVIATNAFSYKILQEVHGFIDVVTIEAYAFAHCPLVLAECFMSAISMGEKAFDACNSLESLTVSDLLESVGVDALKSVPLRTLNIVLRNTPQNAIVRVCNALSGKGQSGQITNVTFSLGDDIVKDGHLVEYLNEILDLSKADVPLLQSVTTCTLDLGAAMIESELSGLTGRGGLVNKVSIAGKDPYSWPM